MDQQLRAILYQRHTTATSSNNQVLYTNPNPIGF